MSGSENEIPLRISLTGDQAVERAIGVLTKLYDIVGRNEAALGRLPDGFQGLRQALGQVSTLLNAIGTGTPAVAVLNALGREAHNLKSAVSQAEFERLKATPALVQRIVREANPAELRKALTALEQELNRLRMLQAELAQTREALPRGSRDAVWKQEQAARGELARAERSVAQLQAELEAAKAQAAEDRAVAGRARSVRARGRFLNETPEGQQLALEKQIREQTAAGAKAERERAAALRESAREAERLHTAFEKFRASQTVTGRVGTTARRAGMSAAVSGAIMNEEETLQALVEQGVNTTRLRERVKELVAQRMGRPPPGTAPERRPFDATAARQRRYDTYLGDGGAMMLGLQAHLQIHYALLNSLFSAYHNVTSAVVEFDAAMHELSAVSGASTVQLEKLQRVIVDTSRATPFSAKEVAAVATEMAQNGIPSGEIVKALPNIANLASATGAGLKEAADMFSSAFEVFKVRGAESAHIADQLTLALTHTRVSADKFAGALQSVSTTAATNGMTFAQTTAALGAMADQGLRSGTLLGTGLRQVLLDLEAPPKKLAERFAELGISSEKLDVKTNGLVGVLQNLHDAGFTTSDAFATMQSRSAQAFAALLNGSDDLKRLYDSLLLTSNAAAANAERMDSLSSRWQRLQNSVTALALDAGGPLMGALKTTVGGLASLAGAASEGGKTLSVLGTVMASLAGGMFLKWIGHLAANFSVARNGATALRGAITALAEGETVAAVATRALSGALGGVLPFAALATGVAGLIWGLSSYANATTAVADKEQALKDATDNATQAFQDKSKALESVDTFLESTVARESSLRQHQDLLNTSVLEARNKFGDLSSAVFENINSYDQLIAKISMVRSELRDGLLVDVTRAKDALNSSVTLQQGVIAAHSGSEGVAGALRGLGVALPSDVVASQAAAAGASVSLPTPNVSDLLSSVPANLRAIPSVMHALQAIGSGDSRAAAQAFSELSHAPGGVAASLKGALTPLIDAQRKIDQSQGQLSQANTQENLVRLTRTSEYATLQSRLDWLAPTVATLNHLNDQPIVAQRAQAFTDAQTRVQGVLNAYQGMRGHLSGAEQAALDASPVGQRVNEMRALISQRQGEVHKALAASALSNAQLTQQASSRILSERQAAVHDATTPVQLRSAVAGVRSAAQDRYNAQMALSEASFSKRLAAGEDPTLIARERGIVAAGYQAEMQGAIARAQRAHLGGGTGGFTPYTQDPTAAFRHQVDLVNRSASNALSVGAQGVAYHRAFVAAAQQQKQFPKTVLEREHKALAELDAAQAKLDLATRQEQITKLAAINQKVAASLTTTNAEIAALVTKYHIAAGENGQVTGQFANPQSRAAVVGRYRSLSRNSQSLSDYQGTLQAQLTSLNTGASTLQGQVDATAQGSTGASQLTAGDYVGAFMAKHNASGPISAQSLKLAQDAADGLTNSFGKFFDIFVTGARRGQNVFREFSTSILRNMTQTLSNQVAASFLGMVGMGLVGAPSTGAPGPSGSSPSPSTGTGMGVMGMLGMGGLGAAMTTGAVSGVGGFGGLLGGLAGAAQYMLGGPAASAYTALPAGVAGPVLQPGMLSTIGSSLSSAASTAMSWLGSFLPGAYEGATLPLHFARGGLVPGANLGRDTVPAMLAGGEAVLNQRAVHMVGAGTINALNSGAVVRNSTIAPLGPQSKQQSQVNVWVVDKSTQPQLSPQDVMAVIGNDIMTGGPMKKLIRSVAVGG